MTNSPRYGPIGYGNNKMPRWMKLIFESSKNLSPLRSHPLNSPSIRVSRRRVRRVKAK